MAELAWTDVCVLADGYDLSGDSNQASLDITVDDLDVTNFKSGGARERISGLQSVSLSVSGHGGFADPDSTLFAALGTSGPVTLVPEGNTVGNVAYLFRASHLNYSQGGAVGEVYGYEFSGSGRSKPVRGVWLNDPDTAVTATGDGTAVEYQAATSGQSLYACLHVLEVSGTTPTLDVTIESDTSGVFSTPATQVTFAQATATGDSEWVTPVAGPVTDTWYRVSYTVGGTSPSFKFAVSFGIA